MSNDKNDRATYILYLYQMYIKSNHTLARIEIDQTEGNNDNQISMDPTQAVDVALGIIRAAEELAREAGGEAEASAFQAATIRQLADALGFRSQVDDLLKAMEQS